MKKAEIPCPEVVLLRKHILVMSFIGKDHVPAPKLKDVALSSEDMKKAFYQVLYVGAATRVLLEVEKVEEEGLVLISGVCVCVQLMQQLYQECNLVHADLSEYNMLWHEGKVGGGAGAGGGGEGRGGGDCSVFLSFLRFVYVCVRQVWLIDVSQSVEPTHPHGLEFLFRDCRNVSTVSRPTSNFISKSCL